MDQPNSPWLWKKKNGKILNIREMPTSYIKSCIALMERWARQDYRPALYDAKALLEKTEAELAKGVVESWIRRLERNGWRELLPAQHATMVDELNRRGVTQPTLPFDSPREGM